MTSLDLRVNGTVSIAQHLVRNRMDNTADPTWSSIDEVCRNYLGLPLFSRNLTLWQAMIQTFFSYHCDLNQARERLDFLIKACYPEPLERVGAFVVGQKLRFDRFGTDEVVFRQFEEAFSQLDNEKRNYPQDIQGLVGMCLVQRLYDQRSRTDGLLQLLASLLLTRSNPLEYLVDCLVDWPDLLGAVLPHLIKPGHLGESVNLAVDQFVPKFLHLGGNAVQILLDLLGLQTVLPNLRGQPPVERYKWILANHPEWACEQLLRNAPTSLKLWPKLVSNINSDYNTVSYLMREIAPTFGCRVVRKCLLLTLSDMKTQYGQFVSLVWRVWDAEKDNLPLTQHQLTSAFGTRDDDNFGLRALIAA